MKSYLLLKYLNKYELLIPYLNSYSILIVKFLKEQVQNTWHTR